MIQVRHLRRRENQASGIDAAAAEAFANAGVVQRLVLQQQSRTGDAIENLLPQTEHFSRDLGGIIERSECDESLREKRRRRRTWRIVRRRIAKERSWHSLQSLCM